MFCILYVDDGVFAFESRKQIEIGSIIVQRQFSKFGFQMHVGSNAKASKTEAVFFSSLRFFKQPPSLPPLENSSSALPLVTKPKKENETKKYYAKMRVMIN